MKARRTRAWIFMSLTAGITLACGLNPIPDLPGKDKKPPDISTDGLGMDDSIPNSDDGLSPGAGGGGLQPWRPGTGGATGDGGKAGAGGSVSAAGGGSAIGGGFSTGAGGTPQASTGGAPSSGGSQAMAGSAGALGLGGEESGPPFFMP